MTFGGLYILDNQAPPEVSIVVVGGEAERAAIHDRAVSGLQAISQSALAFVRLRYVNGNRPFAQLIALRDRVVNDLESWSSRALPASGTGLADQANKVQVLVPRGADLRAYQVA